MEDARQINYGVVDKGLAKMLPGKFVERETPAQEKRESRAHEMMESKAYEKKEHKLMQDTSKDRKVPCRHCQKLTGIGAFCINCGKSQHF